MNIRRLRFSFVLASLYRLVWAGCSTQPSGAGGLSARLHACTKAMDDGSAYTNTRCGNGEGVTPNVSVSDEIRGRSGKPPRFVFLLRPVRTDANSAVTWGDMMHGAVRSRHWIGHHIIYQTDLINKYPRGSLGAPRGYFCCYASSSASVPKAVW